MKRTIVLMLIVAIVFALNSRGYARQFDPSITGKELMCEMVQYKPSRNTPGIYAIDPSTGKAKSIIPYGHKPLWSYEHKYLLYLLNGETCIADVINHEVYVLGAFLTKAEYCWWPDNTAFVYPEIDTPGSSLIPWKCDVSKSGYKQSPLWSRDECEQTGKISICSDKKHVAYESLIVVPNFGVVNSCIKVCKIGEKRAIQISSESIGEAICFNPLWQPNGNLLAFEAFYPKTRERKIFYWNLLTGETILYPIMNRKCSSGDTIPNAPHAFSLYQWSHKGDSILIANNSTKQALNYGGFICEVPIDTDELIRTHYGALSRIVNVKFSPDDMQIAILRSSALENYVYSDISFTIANSHNPANTIEVEIPDGLQPIDISW